MPPIASTAARSRPASPEPGIDAATLAAAFDGVAGGVAIYGADDLLVFCNTAYRRGLGLELDPVGRSFEDLLRATLRANPAAGDESQAERRFEEWLTLHRTGG